MADQTLRKDAGKAPWHLLPFDALSAVVRVLAFGASKYRERGWETGMAWSRVQRSLVSHAIKWFLGEDRDEESGELHTAHMACNALFALAYQLRGSGEDDRPKLPADKRAEIVALFENMPVYVKPETSPSVPELHGVPVVADPGLPPNTIFIVGPGGAGPLASGSQ